MLAVVLVTALFAGAAHAGDLVASEETVGVTSSTDTTTDTTGNSDPVVSPTEPEAPATDPSTPSDAGGSTSETPTDPATPTEPPAEPIGGSESPTPPEASAPPPEPTTPPAEVPGDVGIETPPVIEPTNPPAELPVATSDGDHLQAPAELAPSGGAPYVTAGADITPPFGLDLFQIGEGTSTKHRDPPVSNSDAQSKPPGAMRSFSPERSPASSSSSGASGGTGTGGSGGGVGLAVEFLLAALIILRYAPRISFTLPHSRVFALREERPG